MNTAKENHTEQAIMRAAEELFFQNGFEATSTVDIARKVGCNQALVHYYFRTKENLFQQIFMKNFENFLSFATNYSFDVDFTTLLRQIIENYFKLLTNNRKLPFFLINEFLLNEDRRLFVRENVVHNERRSALYYRFDKLVQDEVGKGKIRPISTLDLLLNIVSLAVFTFVSLPMYIDWLEKDENEVEDYIEQRKNEIITLILNGLKK